jgi:hypothetical protein
MNQEPTIATVLNWQQGDIEAWILSEPSEIVAQYRAAVEEPGSATLPLVVLANRGLPLVLDAVIRSEAQTSQLRDLAIQMLKLLGLLNLETSERPQLVSKTIALLNSNRAANHKLAIRILPLLGSDASAAIPTLKQHARKTSIGNMVQSCIEKIREANTPVANSIPHSQKGDTDTVEFAGSLDETKLSSESAKFVVAADRSMGRIPEKIKTEVSKLHKMLSELEGMTFSNDQAGHDEAFEVIKHVNAWARALSRVLVHEDSPVFLIRRPVTSSASKEAVCIQVFDYFSGNLNCEGNSIPLLSSKSDSTFPFSSSARESIDRFEAMEQLMKELALLSGHRSVDRTDALRIKDLINGLRRSAGVSLGYVGPKTRNKLEKVSLVVSHSSFALRRSFDNETIFTGKIFPEITILPK